jgi:hypothetical protein
MVFNITSIYTFIINRAYEAYEEIHLDSYFDNVNKSRIANVINADDAMKIFGSEFAADEVKDHV